MFVSLVVSVNEQVRRPGTDVNDTSVPCLVWLLLSFRTCINPAPSHRMEDTDQPSATRAGVSRTTQACQRCRNLKTRCLPSAQSGLCQRYAGQSARRHFSRCSTHRVSTNADYPPDVSLLARNVLGPKRHVERGSCARLRKSLPVLLDLDSSCL